MRQIFEPWCKLVESYRGCVALSCSFLMIHVNYYCFHSLELFKVCNSYPRSIKFPLGIVLTVTNLTKVLWSFTAINGFVDNYEGSLLDLVFSI